jgi:hypothetical protein
MKFNTKAYSIPAFIIFISAFLYLAAITYIIFQYFGEGMRPYVKGEIMINYFCGFVRRGLLGTVIIWLSNITSFAPNFLMNVLVGLSYISLLTYFIFKLKKVPILLFVLIASPFGLLFLANDWDAVGRKEVFLFLITVLIFNQWRLLSNNKRIIYITILSIIAFLIHESFLLLFLPWILLGINPLNDRENNGQRFFNFHINKEAIILIIAMLTVFLLSIAFNNNRLVSKIDCLKPQYAKLVESADVKISSDKAFVAPLLWLDKDLKFGIEAASKLYLSRDTLYYWGLRFLILGMTIGLLVLITKRIYKFDFNFNKQLLWYLLIFGGFIIQLSIAIDWGRFFHIFLINFFLFIIHKRSINQNLIFSLGQQTSISILFLIIVFTSFLMVPVFYSGGPERTFFMQSLGNKILGLVH